MRLGQQPAHHAAQRAVVEFAKVDDVELHRRGPDGVSLVGRACRAGRSKRSRRAMTVEFEASAVRVRLAKRKSKQKLLGFLMSKLEIHQFPCLSDNFGVLIRDADAGVVASIDAPDAKAVAAALAAKGWRLTHILTTHHHGDHTERQPGAQGRDAVQHHRAARRGGQDPRHRHARWARATPSRSARTRCACWTRPAIPPATSATGSPRPAWPSSATRCSPSAAAASSRATRR